MPRSFFFSRFSFSFSFSQSQFLKPRQWLTWTAFSGVLLLAGCQSTPSNQQQPTPPTTAMRSPTLGLALGGGAARGFAHIGVIQVLEQHGIKPQMVTGTSAGSLVAALYASGKNGVELENLAMKMDESTITDWKIPFFSSGSSGLLKGDALANYVRQTVGGKTIEQMPIKLGILSTNLYNGDPVFFQRGDTGLAVRASSAVPGVFTPVRIGNTDYVDGGLVSPVPVIKTREMGADIVLAIDISSSPEGESADGNLAILLKTYTIMGKSINSLELAKADIVVRPNLVGVSSADFTAKKRNIEAGRAAMLAAIPKLKEELAKLRPEKVR